MTKKFSAARKRAFLTYLSQTGNQTLAAERAKVSRSWVQLHRSSDAAFDAACRRAIAEARVRLGPSIRALGAAQDERGSRRRRAASQDDPSIRAFGATQDERRGTGTRRPPDGWVFHEGEELVVNGSNGRRVQVRRAKLSQWTARVEERFLAALRATCNVKAACRHVGLWPPSAYAHAKRWPDFAERWERAVAIGEVELEMRLHQGIRHFFDPEIPEPELPIDGVTVSDAIRVVERAQRKRR